RPPRGNPGATPRLGLTYTTTRLTHKPESTEPACQACGFHHPLGTDCRTGKPKWTVPYGFPKSRCLYGYAAARRSQASFVVLVEGAGDVFRLTEARYPALALLGTGLSNTQVEKLRDLDRTVIVALDNDKAGAAGARQVNRQLRRAGVRARVCPPTR